MKKLYIFLILLFTVNAYAVNDGTDEIFPSGNVGIGTTAPSEALEVTGDQKITDGDPHLEFETTTAGHDDFELYAYDSEFYCTNVTDSEVLWKVNTLNLINFYNQAGFTFPDGAPADNQILKFDAVLNRLAWEADAGGAGGGETLAQTLALGADANDVATTSWGKMEGFDAGLYLDWDADGVMDITSDGTLELHSADWDISTTGAITNAEIDADNNTVSNIVIGAECTGASTALTDTADILYEAELDDFSELDAQISDKALINLADGGTFTGNVIANGNLSVGNAATTAGVLTLLEDDDDGSNFASFMVPALAANTVYTLPPDDGDAGEQLQTNGSGTLTWEAAGSGGATAWDDIGNPDNNGAKTITFDNAETSILIGDNDAAASFFTLQNSDADHTGGNFYLLDLDYSADDGDADADFIKFQDSGGVVMTIQQNGEIATDGGITAGGTITATGSFIIGGADMAETDLEKLDGITNGTGAANKALVADANIDIDIGTGDFACTDLDASGSTTLAGTTFSGDIQLGETDIKLDATLSGDAKWSGIVISGTSGVTTLAVGDLCYLNNDDSRWELVDANLSDGYDKMLGICVLAAADGSATEMLIYGKVRSAVFPAFTVGSPLYMSETAGDVTHTAPVTTDACVRIVGFAITAEDMLFNPSNDYYTHI